jgi:hypothetical protein
MAEFIQAANKSLQRDVAGVSSLSRNVDGLGYTYHEFKKGRRLTRRLPACVPQVRCQAT